MIAPTKKNNLELILACSLAILGLNAIACVGPEEDPEVIDGNSAQNNTSANNASTNNATPQDSQEYAEAIPSAEMLELDTTDAEQGLRVQALEGEMSEEDGEPSPLRVHIGEVREHVNAMLERLHGNIDKVIAEGTLVATVDGERQCRVWDYDGQRVAWRLLVCREKKELEGIDGKAFGWIAFGRSLESENDEDFKAVVAGVGAKLMREDGKRGGGGRVYYDLDRYAMLSGEDVAGKIGVGYRAAGKARQMILGLKDFKPRGQEDTRSSLYHYTHVIGRGGLFSFLTHHDLLARDMEGLLELGKDGEKEYGRAVVGWNREGNARVAMDACGGTVGQGSCVHLRQCYQADGPVTFEQLTAEESDLQWEQSSCATTPLRVEEAPEEAEVEFEMSAEEMDIPGEFDESQMVEGM